MRETWVGAPFVSQEDALWHPQLKLNVLDTKPGTAGSLPRRSHFVVPHTDTPLTASSSGGVQEAIIKDEGVVDDHFG